MRDTTHGASHEVEEDCLPFHFHNVVLSRFGCAITFPPPQLNELVAPNEVSRRSLVLRVITSRRAYHPTCCSNLSSNHVFLFWADQVEMHFNPLPMCALRHASESFNNICCHSLSNNRVISISGWPNRNIPQPLIDMCLEACFRIFQQHWIWLRFQTLLQITWGMFTALLSCAEI